MEAKLYFKDLMSLKGVEAGNYRTELFGENGANISFGDVRKFGSNLEKLPPKEVIQFVQKLKDGEKRLQSNGIKRPNSENLRRLTLN